MKKNEKFEKKKNINKMIILMFLCIIVYNLGHPATPALIEVRGWKKSISGELLAFMSTAMFISSPYLGALADRVGMKRIFVFMPICYGMSQLIFGFGTNVPFIFLARMISGFASGGTYAVAFGYVSQLSEKGEKAKNIAKVSSATVIGGAIGQKIGGYAATATNDPRTSFALQFIGGSIVSIIILLIMKEIVKKNDDLEERSKKDLNPFATFRYIKELDGYSKFFCLIILLSGIGIYSYGSALNYFLKFYEKVSSDTIGTFVMCSSLLAFFGTAFLLGKLLKKFKEKSIYKFLIFVGIILMAVILFRVKLGVTPYLLMAVYTMTYEIVRSLGNTIIAQRYKENQGKILGVASAVGSLGTAIGSLLSGHLLNFNPFLPFVVNIIVMFFVLVLILVKKL
ncbi:MFS transporter [Leptotrichia sp. oral taxon 879]|uniref:MFS transporter n=1 Tax=Leptotrichia mesophila TaxID=3239303 RepID=A0AB39VAN6_9FUSO|nr:MFS transporter [Leptotrichia sp. oral taxon 879]ERK51207.1 transporter, major facilitator family protein [Leptotrichia sp. oral taxon 879 str. F0557]